MSRPYSCGTRTRPPNITKAVRRPGGAALLRPNNHITGWFKKTIYNLYMHMHMHMCMCMCMHMWVAPHCLTSAHRKQVLIGGAMRHSARAKAAVGLAARWVEGGARHDGRLFWRLPESPKRR